MRSLSKKAHDVRCAGRNMLTVHQQVLRGASFYATPATPRQRLMCCAAASRYIEMLVRDVCLLAHTLSCKGLNPL